MNFLLINTAGKESWVAKARGGEVAKTKRWKMGRVSGEVLEGIEAVLEGEKVEKVGVVTGPGGFTAARVGVVVANALAKSWGVKVVGVVGDPTPEELAEEVVKQEGEEIAKPYYQYAPHITKPKNG